MQTYVINFIINQLNLIKMSKSNYQTDCGRNFMNIEKILPEENSKVCVHTKENEVISVKYMIIGGEAYFQNLDFEGSTDLEDIKGWNYFHCL